MRIDAVVFTPEVIEKIARKHQVTPEEAEEIFEEAPRYRFVEKGRRQGEDVYMAYGQTAAGRYLVALFIWKLTHEALVISARDMARKERRWYGKK